MTIITQPKLEEIAQILDKLGVDELLEVQAMVGTLIEAKSLTASKSTIQMPKIGKGHIEERLIPDKKTGKVYGPYRYLRYWEKGKLKCRYLGKVKTTGS